MRWLPRITTTAVMASAAVAIVAFVGASHSQADVVSGFPPTTPAGELPLGIAWGDNGFGLGQGQGGGVLGDGTFTSRTAPVAVNGGQSFDGKEVSEIRAGTQTACGLTDGKVACWGNNESGSLGTGSDEEKANSPQLVGGALSGKTVTAVAPGLHHVCALADGEVFCWGRSGKLGTGSAEGSPFPVRIDHDGALAGKTITGLTSGSGHTCALASGQVFCWGSNVGGVLGNGSQQSSLSPVAVNAAGQLKGKVVTAISSGEEHVCALADGRVFCWGDNSWGQLGSLGAVSSPVPVAVPANGALKGRTVKSIDAGGKGTCAIAGTGENRTPFCWGRTTTFDFSPEPAQVVVAGHENSVDMISVGLDRVCALADAEPLCWGRGPLGNGTTLDDPMPTPVSDTGVLSGHTVVSISSGGGYAAGVAMRTPVFADLQPTSPFFDDAAWLYGKGIATFAPGAKAYGPNDVATRASVAQFLFRFKNPGVDDHSCDPTKERQFSDLPATHPACGPAEWMVAQGIIAGGGVNFTPDAGLARGIMAVWFFRSQNPGAPVPTCSPGEKVFEDVIGAMTPNCGYVKWISKVGVNTVFCDGTYRPAQTMNRMAIARFFHRMDGLVSR